MTHSGDILNSELSNLFAQLSRTPETSTLAPLLCASVLVGLGAIPGALSRYYITVLASQWLGTAFPYGTFIINLTGATLIGFLSTLIPRQANATDLQSLWIVGFLGAYTTFSTYALDTSNLLRAGNHKRALIYWWGSAILGFLGVELGIFLARQMI